MTDLTPQQRENLTVLAAYLRTLPADYPDFAMDQYVNSVAGYADDHAHRAECGTAACAAGHGPRAGIDPLPGETWWNYSRRAFCPDGYAWSWCFDEVWADIDNTAHGAAARIEWLLKNGVPDDVDAQQGGCAPLCYTTTLSLSDETGKGK